MKKEPKKKRFKALRILAKVLAGFLLFILLIILFIRSPWGQDLIADKLISNFAKKTNTTIEVERLFITFSGNIFLDGVYLEDKKGDTLLYSKELEADIPLLPIIRGKGISVTSLEWSGVRANISRKDTVQGYNFEFLQEAFATDTTTTSASQASQDTTSSPQKINIGQIFLKDIHLTYNDEFAGMDAELVLENLDLEMETFDLENMNFFASELSISDTKLAYYQTKAIPETDEEEEETPMPNFGADNLNLENIHAIYESRPDSIQLNAEIGMLASGIPEIDVGESKYRINEIDLQNSVVSLNIDTNQEAGSSAEENPTEESEAFPWPEFDIELERLNLENNDFAFTENNKEPQEGTFDPSALFIQNLTIKAGDFILAEERAELVLEELIFEEASGIDIIDIKVFSGNFKIDERSLDLSGLQVHINENRVEGDLSARYNSLSDFLNNQEDARLALDLPVIELNPADMFLFQPGLRENEYLRGLSTGKISGKISASGILSEVEISKMALSWKNTTVNTRGTVSNLMNPENIGFNLPVVRIESQREDLQLLMDEEALGFRIPDELLLEGNINGTPENIAATAVLKSSDGDIDLDGEFSSGETLAFEADIKTMELDLGNLLTNESFGKMNLELKSSGAGNDVNSLDASLDATVQSFSFNDYEIKDLPVTGNIKDGSGSVNTAYKDENLEADLDALVKLDSVAPEFTVDLDIIGADLQALGLTARNIRTGFDLNASYKGSTEAYDVEAKITDAIAVYENEPYLAGDLDMDASVRPDSTAMHINNHFIDFSLESNADPLRFIDAVKNHYLSYLTEVERDTTQPPVNLEFRGEIRQDPLLNEVFISNLEEMDTITINVDFSEKERELIADVDFPMLQYGSNVIDSLEFHLDSGPENFDFVLGFNSLEGGPVKLQKTYLEGEVADEKLFLDFIARENDSLLVHVMTETSREKDTVRIQLDPSELILDGNLWDIPENNSITFTETNVLFDDFRMSNDEQAISIDNTSGETAKEHFAVNFENFALENIFSYFNSEQELAGGNLNGQVVIEEPYGSTGILAGLEIEDFRVMEAPFGRLTFNAAEQENGFYDFDLAVKEGDVDMDITGGFRSDEVAAELNLDLQLNEMKMTVLEHFSQDQINNSSGSVSGNMEIGGTTLEPEYSGRFNFNQAAFNVTTLNADFVLQQEQIDLDNEGIYMEDFTIEDKNGNAFVVNGEILTETYLNPEFDLQLQASNFNALNSTEEDNELFYGRANFDTDVRITGSLNLPEIDGTITVNPETNMTYVMPGATLEKEERDGVVRFVNREDPDDILTGSSEEETATLSGIVLNSIIEIKEGARFNLIIDEQTGDNFSVSGNGDLNFTIASNGRTNLSGQYEVNTGHYEMSLYGLVNRRFEIVEGSSISWSGDVMDASLDVRARYDVETSASSLMASGTSTDISNRFRQELPFQVYLNIEGELMQPQLNFDLDMPEAEQGAIDGQVYGRVQQINQQEEELNKQVFSLLVLNRFFPESGSDGSRGGATDMARDNINQALSDQLNRFSDQIMGDSGIELNFGVDSFTDYQGESPQERTQLDITAQRRLMDDRLIVSVGSEVDVQGSNPTGEPNPVIGNVSLEYLLTENGRLRLKGFRRNQFENIIDGQLIVNGIALIFTREFNKFTELWDNILGNKEEEE